MTRVLVIGGTGPTGTPLVRDLVARGFDVSIMHRGLHERPETPHEVTHLHHDPYDDAGIAMLREHTWDVVVAMYGRLRRIAEATAGRTAQFVSVGGVPAYRGWMHPFDDKGRRRDYKDIPKSVRDLVDDPFRSLAGELRRAGGFAKDTTPFSEFLWADFLRRRIKRRLIERDFDRALITAMKFAKSQEAIYLPGWGGQASLD